MLILRSAGAFHEATGVVEQPDRSPAVARATTPAVWRAPEKILLRDEKPV